MSVSHDPPGSDASSSWLAEDRPALSGGRQQVATTRCEVKLHRYRVTVRGRFGEIDETMRDALITSAKSHDALTAAFTRDGTFVYDLQYGAFSYRYEVRSDAEDHEADAHERGIAQALIDLASRGIPHRDLRSTVADMASVWERSGDR